MIASRFNPRPGRNSCQLLKLPLLCLFLALITSGCTKDGAPSIAVRTTSRQVEVDPFNFEIDLGVLHQGESRVHRCWINNDSTVALEIARFKPSCECLSASIDDHVLLPGEKTLITIRLDGEHDSDFIGSLAVVVTAVARNGRVLGQFTTSIEVIAEDGDASATGSSPFPEHLLD
jgi:hypothetical protein